MIRVLLAALILVPVSPVLAEPLVFEGQVVAAREASLASRVTGVVTEILFEGGEPVTEGQPLIRLDPSDAKLALDMAEARLADAKARLEGAERQALRQEELFARGVTSDAAVGPVRTARAAARATVALAEAELGRAALDLERTTIRAPIDGYVSRPNVTIGAFLEAKVGPALATIIALDPVTIAYQAPYADRLRSLEESGAATVGELLSRIRVQLVLPGNRAFPGSVVPRAASPDIEPETGSVTVWATFPNPDALLRPGMTVTVHSTIEDLAQ